MYLIERIKFVNMYVEVFSVDSNVFFLLATLHKLWGFFIKFICFIGGIVRLGLIGAVVKILDMKKVIEDGREYEAESTDLELSLKKEVHKHLKSKVENPHVIGYFSIDENRNYEPGLSKLKYMNKKTGVLANMDLNGGEFDVWKKTNINHFPFYDYLLDHTDMVEDLSGEDIDDVGFIAERSTLMDIFNMTYNHVPRKVFVTRLYRGHIYIRSVRNPHDVPDKIARQGHKYEQYMTSYDPHVEPDTSKKIIESDEFALVFEMYVNDHFIMYSSENDGILANDDKLNLTPLDENMDEKDIVLDLQSRKFVRLMTNAKHYKDKTFRKYKTQHIWPKLFFSRSDKVVLGMKNKDGIVTKLAQCSREMLRKRKIGRWNPDPCFKFMDAFFTFIKDTYLREIVHEPHDSIKDVKSTEIIFEKRRESLKVVRCDSRPEIGNIRKVQKAMNEFIEAFSEKINKKFVDELEEGIKNIELTEKNKTSELKPNFITKDIQ